MSLCQNIIDVKGIDRYISACSKSYSRCVDVISHSHIVNGIDANIRLHYVKFDANGRPMIAALANTLYEHIIDYCISARNRSSLLDPKMSAKLTREARKLFIRPEIKPDNPDETGEAGEILLYFLIESVLLAPQIVAKMELKTNRRDEVKGSDGIHMKWNEKDSVVDMYFGEAKLHKTMSSAITSMLTSVDSFHSNEMVRYEFSMATKHFKYSDDNVKEAVVSLLESGAPSGDVRINHACLVGYDWKEYSKLDGVPKGKVTEEFIKMYMADSERIYTYLQDKLNSFTHKHLRFDVFFLPFPTVQSFRTAFNEALL
jgi:hypothetical protein